MKELTVTDRTDLRISNAEALYIYITGQVGHIENAEGAYKCTLVAFIDPMSGKSNAITDYLKINEDIRQSTVLHGEASLSTPTYMYGTLLRSDKITTVTPNVPFAASCA